MIRIRIRENYGVVPKWFLVTMEFTSLPGSCIKGHCQNQDFFYAHGYIILNFN